MAVRQIRKYGDEVLRRKSRPVDVFDERLAVLLDDMVETMNAAKGVGLAAPQVGILRQAVVIDVGEGLVELVNPKIIEKEGEVIDVEGCLSIPRLSGEVSRPKKVRVRAQDRKGRFFEIEGEDLLARALCHEIDHLHGILFVDKVIRFVESE
jgi:peptide deformylase